jgi:choline kinase
MTLRVCIPTAGIGSRLGELTTFLNKSLVSIANRPVLSHLIEQCAPDAEFVIALGHKGALVRQFLELAYPERTFFFAEVDRFEGPGSGLGYSLLQCKPYLQQPFIFLSCDTLVREALPALDRNWIGYAAQDDLGPYRTVEVAHGQARALCEKGEGRPGTHQAYIGLAGIADHAAFWAAMEAGGASAIDSGEACGLRQLLAGTVEAHRFTWFDTGRPAALEAARAAYHMAGAPNILPKANEAIWFVGQQVIKFSDDRDFIANRVKRAAEIAQYVPCLTGVRPNMYSYRNVAGAVLADVIDLPLFARLLEHCRGFWREAELDAAARSAFQERCRSFYHRKTLERVELYYRNFDTRDGCESINGVAMPTLAALLAQVDWDELAAGLPGRFHGDFHFENLLWNSQQQAFTFLDWRQDFGGSLTVGDIYYDFAKLLHGLIVSHELIADEHYQSERAAGAIRYDFHRKQMLVACERYFDQWLVQHGYSVRKVHLLTALIYLNIAALHHAPYSHLLYALGKDMLHSVLRSSTPQAQA